MIEESNGKYKGRKKEVKIVLIESKREYKVKKERRLGREFI